MTNIYDFPSRKNEEKGDGFLQQGSDTLAFDESGKHVDFSDKVYQSLERSRSYESANWSNQELASIYRVKCLLDAAKVPCTVERGQSDEGDPWCVYCTPGGEVFIHLCRISGTYILDSPNLSAPISGANFTQLIERFSDGALQKTRESNGQTHRVVKLTRGDNVFLHPATLLAALIWSIYVESEDLVLLSQDEEETPSRDDAILQVNGLVENPPAHELLNEAAFINGHAPDADLMTGRLPDHLNAGDAALVVGADYSPQRDMTGKNGLFMPQTVIATGLSAIAVAVGLLSESFIDKQPNADLADLLATLPDDPSNEALLVNVENLDKTKGMDLAAVVSSFFDQLVPNTDAEASTLSEEIAANTSPAAPGSTLSADAMTLLAELAATLRAQIDPAVETDAAESVELADLLIDLPATDGTVASTPPQTPATIGSVSLSGFVDNALMLTGLQNIFDDMLQQYALGSTVVEASFDIASIDESEAIVLERLLPNEADMEQATPVREEFSIASAPEPPALQTDLDDDRLGFAIFNDNVRNFVNYLLDKSEKVEMIATESELIFIDFAAFDEVDYVSHTMTWSLGDGGTVSVVGLESEFQDFDLIVA